MALAVSAACGGDLVSYSEPVGITLRAKPADTMNGIISEEKSINTEAGNPYGAFVGNARARIGHDPGIIDVESVELRLAPGATGAATLADVFAGAVDLTFQMNDTNVTYPVATGTIDAAAAAGPVAFEVVFAADEVPDSDYVKLLLGSFKLGARGPASPSFATRGAEVDLEITLTFAAFE
jgi:hypothetical protein